MRSKPFAAANVAAPDDVAAADDDAELDAVRLWTAAHLVGKLRATDAAIDARTGPSPRSASPDILSKIAPLNRGCSIAEWLQP